MSKISPPSAPKMHFNLSLATVFGLCLLTSAASVDRPERVDDSERSKTLESRQRHWENCSCFDWHGWVECCLIVGGQGRGDDVRGL